MPKVLYFYRTNVGKLEEDEPTHETGYRKGYRCLINPVTQGRRGDVSPKSTREYIPAIQMRYQKASKAEKGRLLDEVCRVTG